MEYLFLSQKLGVHCFEMAKRLRMIFSFGLTLVSVASLLTLSPQMSRADAACEARIAGTNMIVMKGDEKIVCNEGLSQAAQDCMVGLLTQGKGKLRNPDFFEIYGLCKRDSSKELSSCVVRRLSKSWDDPNYQGVHIIGDQCTAELKGVQVKSYPTEQELTESMRKRWKRQHPENTGTGQQPQIRSQQPLQQSPAAIGGQLRPSESGVSNVDSR